MSKPIGIFGGTFDPVHYGHLHSAWAALEQLQLDHIRLIPCHIPPHRDPAHASTQDRVNMLEYATQSVSELVIDPRETLRDGPSYTVDTLATLREDFPSQSLCLLLGMDAFAGLTRWHHWEALTDYAHLVVFSRPDHGLPTDSDLNRFLKAHQADSSDALHQETHGKIVLMDTLVPLDISATAIRTQLQAGQTPKFLLPDAVLEYIQTKQLYRGEHA